jgi:hypothetical protein
MRCKERDIPSVCFADLHVLRISSTEGTLAVLYQGVSHSVFILMFLIMHSKLHAQTCISWILMLIKLFFV